MGELFAGKCAYCEIRIQGAEWDVEHFRPKGRVQERPDHPGYYWLAYAWSNLYAACKYCNQRRLDKPTWLEPTTGPLAGKGDQFPLGDESTRAMAPGDDLTVEDRLLIDPCEDDPERYLGYDPVGQIFSIDDDLRGERTISVFALSRRRLRVRRREVIWQTLSILKLVDLAEQSGDSASADLARTMLEALKERGEHGAVSRFVERNESGFLG